MTLLENENSNGLFVIHDIAGLDQQFPPGLFVEGPLRLSVDLVQLRVAVLHVVESDLVLRATKHCVLDEAGIPTKPVKRDIESRVGRGRLYQSRKLQRTGLRIYPDSTPGILCVGSQLIPF